MRGALMPELVRLFSERGLVPGTGDVIAVIPGVDAEVGDLTLWDDGDEVMVGLGTLTHTHFASYDDSLSNQDARAQIALEVTDFAQALLDERQWLWVSPNGSAGFFAAPPQPLPSYVDADDVLYSWAGRKVNPLASAG
jgi:hypothetical protein